MKEIVQNRGFRLWEYRVSHGQLLYRSPADEQYNTSVDIMFFGTKYLCGPCDLGELSVEYASQSDVEKLEKYFGKLGSQDSVWMLVGTSHKSVIIAGRMTIKEHTDGIFSSPFQ